MYFKVAVVSLYTETRLKLLLSQQSLHLKKVNKQKPDGVFTKTVLTP